LTADGQLTSKKGVIGKWDISETGISKAADNYFVKIAAPESEIDDVITVAERENGVITKTPFFVRADGYLHSTVGNIAGFDISEDGLLKETSVLSEDYTTQTKSRVHLAPGYFETHRSITTGFISTYVGTTKIENGLLEVTRSGFLEDMFNLNMAFMRVVINGNKYNLYIDEETSSIKVSFEA
jgi:hypothetical protein